MFLYFGGSFPDIEDGVDFKKTSGYYLGSSLTQTGAVTECILCYDSNSIDRIEWFEVFILENNALTLVYDDKDLDALRRAGQEAKVKEAVIPKSFLLFAAHVNVLWFGVQSLVGEYPDLKTALNEANEVVKAGGNINRWQIVSMPQRSIVTDRTGGFPGKPFDRRDPAIEAMVDQLIAAYVD